MLVFDGSIQAFTSIIFFFCSLTQLLVWIDIKFGWNGIWKKFKNNAVGPSQNSNIIVNKVLKRQ